VKSKRTKDEVDRGGSVQRANASEVERLVRLDEPVYVFDAITVESDGWPVSQGLEIGDIYTIQGVRRRKDGTYTYRCRPGNETLFKFLG